MHEMNKQKCGIHIIDRFYCYCADNAVNGNVFPSYNNRLLQPLPCTLRTDIYRNIKHLERKRIVPDVADVAADPPVPLVYLDRLAPGHGTTGTGPLEPSADRRVGRRGADQSGQWDVSRQTYDRWRAKGPAGEIVYADP